MITELDSYFLLTGLADTLIYWTRTLFSPVLNILRSVRIITYLYLARWIVFACYDDTGQSLKGMLTGPTPNPCRVFPNELGEMTCKMSEINQCLEKAHI